MSGSESRKATLTTTLRLTPEEREALIAVASAQGLGPSTFARKAALEAAGRSVTVRKRRDAIASVIAPVLGQLGRHGNLLNQLAKYAHTGGRVDPDQLEALRAETERLTLAVMNMRDNA